jgi:hypothetical protein
MAGPDGVTIPATYPGEAFIQVSPRDNCCIGKIGQMYQRNRVNVNLAPTRRRLVGLVHGVSAQTVSATMGEARPLESETGRKYVASKRRLGVRCRTPFTQQI